MLFIYGAEMVERFWRLSIPTLGLPRGAEYLPFPIAGALIFIFSLEHIVRLFTQTDRSAEKP